MKIKKPFISGIFDSTSCKEGKMSFKSTLLSIGILIIGFSASNAQILEPVKWEYEVTQDENGISTVSCEAKIDKHWHVYSSVISDDPNAFGPIPTSIDIIPETSGVKEGDIIEDGKRKTEFDPNFDMDLNYYEKKVTFSQQFKAADDASFVGLMLNYMACDDKQCIFPDPIGIKAYYEEGRLTGFEGVHYDDLLPQEEEAVEDPLLTIHDPVKWKFYSFITGDSEYELVMEAKVDEGWHVYAQHLESNEGPIPTSFRFDFPADVERIDSVKENQPHVEYDPNFQMNLSFFEGKVYWWQKVRTENPSAVISGSLTFMVCDSVKCLPPEDVDFSIDLSESKEKPADFNYGKEGQEGLWFIFGAGFLLGLAALFTPCVFPMIPMTVSFFTKQSKTKGQGIRNAIFYGIFIIVIYTGLGLILTAIFGIDILNIISTDPIFNIFLFLLLLIFGISFLGAFEIQLPTSWANKMDRASDRGGLIGIFFMAATLAIVSFSCTGALVGTALGGAVQGGVKGPVTIMFGFSLALSLPFMLFAAFPGWLNSMPKSGGWLNSVKVVLGLLEIGFAFKFLSNADLVYQWGLLQRETFIAIWVTVSALLALYLFGAFKFPHDSDIKRISVTRFFFGMLFVFLTIYMLPGLWGSPLKLISGFPPPMFYSEMAEVGGSHGSGDSGGHSGHIEAEFRDLEKGLEAAKEKNLPVLVDFTGWACVNCRKMEETVWPVKAVSEILLDKVVLVSLYVDDRNKLPKSEWHTEEYAGKEFRIKTIGNKWTYVQASRFNTNAQPFYVMLDHNGDHIGGSAGYDSDPQLFVDFLNEGLEEFYERHPDALTLQEQHE